MVINKATGDVAAAGNTSFTPDLAGRDAGIPQLALFNNHTMCGTWIVDRLTHEQAPLAWPVDGSVVGSDGSVADELGGPPVPAGISEPGSPYSVAGRAVALGG